MAFSSWLGFGKKKASSNADLSDADEAREQATDDGYVVITRKPNPTGNMYPSFDPSSSSISLPYVVQPTPSFPSHGGSAVSEIHSGNPLDDVPFKLSSQLVGGSPGWSRNDAAFFKSAVSSAVHRNETAYKYDFSHEQSIMRESNHVATDVG